MINPKKGAEYARNLYNLNELHYDNKIDNKRIQHIINSVGSKQHQTILDIGCYDGTIGKYLIDQKNEVYGIEVNKDAALSATEKGLKVTLQDIETKFEYNSNFFDVIIAGEIIEHIVDTDFFIDEIYRMLKPGGILIITTPNAASFGRRLLLLFGKNPYFEASFGFPPEAHAGHVRFFVKDLLINYLQNKNFKIDGFTSDGINFTPSGKIGSVLLGQLFPNLGRSLIVTARCMK